MLEFALTYVLYNLLAGMMLAIAYYRTEGRVADRREFLWLLLFPAVGLGKWRYRQKVRSSEPPEFPEKWFIWNHMVQVNWGYIIAVGLLVLIGLSGFWGFFGSGMDWANGQDNQNAVGFGLLADLGILFLFFLFSVIAVFGFGTLFLVLIFLPRHSMRRIETETFKARYLEASGKHGPGSGA